MSPILMKPSLKTSGMSLASDISNAQMMEGESIVGTEAYISPEMINDKDGSFYSDLWSLGIIIY